MSENYDGDYYGWLATTATALEEGRLGDIDRDQVAEELRDMGKSEKRGVVSHMRIIMMHLLKIRHQPEFHTRSWDLTIAASREALDEEFEDSPSLAALAATLRARAYKGARIDAAVETGLPLETFPVECPFCINDVIRDPQ